jgi:D-3-phosphoglycerate dehydrogenase
MKIVLTPVALCQGENPVVEALRERGYETVQHPGVIPPTTEELRRYLEGAVGMIAGMEPVPAGVIEGAQELRVISRFGVGYDNIDVPAATRRGIVVTSIPDAMVDAVADLTLGLMLALARRIPEFDRGMKAGAWTRYPAVDVTRKCLGIVGTGRIGMAVAERARGFRMALLGYDPAPNPRFVEELGGDYVPLDELLARADFVTLHLPLTPATDRLMSAPQFERMRPSAFLINAARGGLVDEEALYAALTAGQIAGFGTDVYRKEPPDPHPLWSLPNVVATPHVASYTDGAIARMARAALGNLLTVLEGGRPEQVVNPEVYAQLRSADGAR